MLHTIAILMLLVLCGFFLLMVRSINQGAKRRSVRHREIQDRHLGR